MGSAKAEKARKRERRTAADTTTRPTKPGKPPKAPKAAKPGKAGKAPRLSKTPPRTSTTPPGAHPAVGAALPHEDASLHASPPHPLPPRQPPYRRPLFLPRGSLRRRGWTDSGIVRFLGEPDAHAPNPVVPSAARMRLYDEERVAAIEATETWRAWRAASEHRREAARIRAEERAQEHAARFARTGVHPELGPHAANK